MTDRAPKPTIAEALERRISDALSSDDGLAGDPALGKILSSDRGAGLYARDLARINMWLASWPVPEPEDEAMEALATRIEQRLGENLPGAASLYVGNPDFDDDDAMRDATAGLVTRSPAVAVAKPATPAAPEREGIPPKKGTLVGMPLVGRPGGPALPAAKPAIAPPGAAAVPAPAVAGPAVPGPAKPLVAKPEREATQRFGTVAKPDAIKPPSLAKPEPVAPAPKLEPAKVEPAKAAPIAAKVEPPKPIAAKVDPPKVEAPKLEPAKLEPAKVAAPAAAAKRLDELDAPDEAPPSLKPPVAARAAEDAAPPKPPAVTVARTTEDLPIVSGEIELVSSNSIPPEPISIPPGADDAPPPPPSIPKPPAAPVIASVSPPAAPTAKKKKKKSDPPPPSISMDDRISIPMPAALPANDLRSIAPIKAEKDEKKGAGWWPVLAAAAVVGLAVAGGISFMNGNRDASPAATATVTGIAAPADRLPSAPPMAAPSTPMVVAPAEAAGEIAAAEPAMMESEETTRFAGGLAMDSDDRAEAPATIAPMPASAGSSGALGRRARAGSGAAARELSSDRLAESRAAAAPGPSGGATGGDSGGVEGASPSPRGGSGAGGGRSAGPGSGASPPAVAPARPRSGGPAPESPSRETVRDVLEGVRPQVEACFGESHGLAEVVVIVAGSGRVTTSTVSGRFAGTPVGSCIARAVRGARFPEFTNPRFEVHYQYRY